MRFISRLLVLGVTCLSSSLAATCTPSQEQQNAQAAARNSAEKQLGRAAFVYRLMYDKVSYDVDIHAAKITGNTANVRGDIILRGTERKTGKAAQGTYPGTVFLARSGVCGWKVTGYKRG